MARRRTQKKIINENKNIIIITINYYAPEQSAQSKNLFHLKKYGLVILITLKLLFETINHIEVLKKYWDYMEPFLFVMQSIYSLIKFWLFITNRILKFHSI